MDHDDEIIAPDLTPEDGAIEGGEEPTMDWLDSPDMPEGEALPSWLPSDLPELPSSDNAAVPPWEVESPQQLPSELPELPPLEEDAVHPWEVASPPQLPEHGSQELVSPAMEAVQDQVLSKEDLEEPPTVISPSALHAKQVAVEPPPDLPLPSAVNPPLADDQPNLVIERIAPAGKSVRQLVYGIVARNTGPRAVSRIQVEHTLPVGVRYLGSEPPAHVRADGKLVWQLINVAGGATQPIKIRIAPTRPGQGLPGGLAVFQTSYVMEAEVTTALSRPVIRLTWTGPSKVQVGDTGAFQLQVSNTGNGTANQVIVSHHQIEGLSLGDSVRTSLGTLAPGESVKLGLNVTVLRPGPHAIEAWVTCDDMNQTRDKVIFEATQPALELHLSGPSSCRTPEEVEYHIEVSNPGTEVARGVRVVHSIPDGMEFIGAGHDGVHHPAEHAISWKLSDLAPGQLGVVSARLKAVTPGDFVHGIAARADGGVQARLEVAVSNELEAAGHRLLDQLFDEPDEVVFDHAFHSDPTTRVGSSATAGRTRADQHVVFRLAGNTYAVPIDNVLEISRLPGVTTVPNVPDWVLGLVNVRGDIVSLVDLRDFLGQGHSVFNALSRMLVVRARPEEMTAGLMVDEVLGIRFIGADRICAPDLSSDDPVVSYLRGVVDADGKLLVVLDLDRLLLSAEMKQFETV
jgi:purine-binding chemotaxis protein CheW